MKYWILNFIILLALVPAVSLFFMANENARHDAAWRGLRQLKQAVIQYHSDNSSFPVTLADLDGIQKDFQGTSYKLWVKGGKAELSLSDDYSYYNLLYRATFGILGVEVMRSELTVCIGEGDLNP